MAQHAANLMQLLISFMFWNHTLLWAHDVLRPYLRLLSNYGGNLNVEGTIEKHVTHSAITLRFTFTIFFCFLFTFCVTTTLFSEFLRSTFFTFLLKKDIGCIFYFLNTFTDTLHFHFQAQQQAAEHATRQVRTLYRVYVN